jgi:hypothetical protein
MAILDPADLGLAVGPGVGWGPASVFTEVKQQQHIGAGNNIGIFVATGAHSKQMQIGPYVLIADRRANSSLADPRNAPIQTHCLWQDQYPSGRINTPVWPHTQSTNPMYSLFLV